MNVLSHAKTLRDITKPRLINPKSQRGKSGQGTGQLGIDFPSIPFTLSKSQINAARYTSRRFRHCVHVRLASRRPDSCGQSLRIAKTKVA